MDLFSSNEEIFKVAGCEIELDRKFLNLESAKSYFEILHNETPWKQEHINFMGKISPIPRLTYWYSKENKEYTYAGIKVHPVPYTKLIAKLNTIIEEKTGYEFNSVLLNLYRDGNDTVAWHADDEKGLGEYVNIASLSLGAERVFQIRPKEGDSNGESSITNIELNSGSLIVMHEPTQKKILHQIPRRKNVDHPRINLTFRFIP